MIKFLIPLIQPSVRNALTMLATYLVTAGLLDPTQATNFTTITMGLVLGLMSFGWSVVNATKKA